MNVARLSAMRMAAPAAAVTGISLYSIQDAQAKSAVDLAKVRDEIVNVYEKDAEKRGDGTSLAGTFGLACLWDLRRQGWKWREQWGPHEIQT